MPNTKLSVRDEDKALIITADDVPIAHYLYRPDAPAAEAPEPYLHPIRPAADYAGFFWRGPRSWTHGTITAAGGQGARR
ncbi:PmoA family protein [Nonomuraea composti]|uniref:PmoA family protein n=1 Tax=Nonomuraea composti TaxID=2720023 RepID=UPI001F0FF70F|nr:PmoA family protein [Nonomuraea sp. FMUSA5-5]